MKPEQEELTDQTPYRSQLFNGQAYMWKLENNDHDRSLCD